MRTVVCILEDDTSFAYTIESVTEAQRFAQDVMEHSDDILVVELGEPVITTRKQALSDLLGV